MKQIRTLWTLVAGAAMLVACSAASETTEDANHETAQSESALQDEATAASTTACPSKAPKQGATCTTAGAECSWGTDPRFGCRTTAACTGGTWNVTIPSCTEPAPACPAKAPSAPDGLHEACTAKQAGLSCVYAGDVTYTYTCGTNNGGLFFDNDAGAAELLWWNHELDTGCPSTMPNTGTACSTTRNLDCNYNVCVTDQYDSTVHGTNVSCTNGTWQWSDYVCFGG
jgi:hypothetical protein